MSAETALWLNTNTLIGYTERRGPAWHQNLELQAEHNLEPNHYTGPVPFEAVERRLFNFEAVEVPVWIPVPCALEEATGVDPESGHPVRWQKSSAGRKLICADDDYSDLGVFKEGYQPHQYKQWLYEHVASLIGGDLNIGTAARLRNRGVAFLSIELADHVTTVDGIKIDPILFATTSFDGTVQTTYGNATTLPVCDNTVYFTKQEAAKSGRQVKIKHTKGSGVRIHDARQALGLILKSADDAADQITRLCARKVSRPDFNKVLDILVPRVDEKGEVKVGRSLTIADNKRDALVALYNTDNRVSPWRGSAFGVLQCFNTFNQQIATVKNTTRVERNFLNVISGAAAEEDAAVLAALEAVVGTIDLEREVADSKSLISV